MPKSSISLSNKEVVAVTSPITVEPCKIYKSVIFLKAFIPVRTPLLTFKIPHTPVYLYPSTLKVPKKKDFSLYQEHVSHQ